MSQRMPIVQQGSINTTALVVPDLYVQIVPPQNLVLNGVPTNVIGVVGTASWGPVGQPVIVATMADYARAFGPVVARKYRHGHPGCHRGSAGRAELPLRACHRRYRCCRPGHCLRHHRQLHSALHRVTRQQGDPGPATRLEAEHLAPDRCTSGPAARGVRRHHRCRRRVLAGAGRCRKSGAGAAASGVAVRDRRSRRGDGHAGCDLADFGIHRRRFGWCGFRHQCATGRNRYDSPQRHVCVARPGLRDRTAGGLRRTRSTGPCRRHLASRKAPT